MASYWVDCGLLAYEKAHRLQVSLIDACRKTEDEFYLVLEHFPVFTLGRRGGREHLAVSEQFLRNQNIEVIHIERGGDITYHGPGQVIVYPIFNLRKKNISVSTYVSLLEEVMIHTAADAQITAERNTRNHGVWVGDKKLGSIGIAIRHGITFHGLGLNVNTNLDHFDWINPCGLAAVKMTSFQQQKKNAIDLQSVKNSLRRYTNQFLAASCLEHRRLTDLESEPGAE